MLILAIVYIGFIGMALQAYRTAQRIETEFAELEALSVTIQGAELDGDVLETLVAKATQLSAIEDRALGYLGIFESIGFAFTAVAVLFTFIGIVAGFRYDDSIKQMDKAIQRMNDIDEQFESRRRILRESGLAQSLMMLAERQYKSRDIEGALQTYQRALELEENNPVVFYFIGYILTQKNMLTQARDILIKAKELEPLPQIQAALGYVYRRIGDEADKVGNYGRRNEHYELADKYLHEALESSPRLVDVDGESWYGSLAGLHKRLGNIGDNETPEQERQHLRQARDYYARAAEVTPLSSYPKFNIAMMTLRLDGVDAAMPKFKETERIIEKELQAEHDNHWYWANLLLTKVALQAFKGIDDTVDTLSQLIPPHANDVKPRIVEDIRQIQQMLATENVNTEPIEAVINKLNGNA